MSPAGIVACSDRSFFVRHEPLFSGSELQHIALYPLTTHARRAAAGYAVAEPGMS
jgi:hypothetical protein